MTTSFTHQPVLDLHYLVTSLAQARQVEQTYKDTLAGLQKEIDALIDEKYGRVLANTKALLEVAKDEVSHYDDLTRLYAVQHFDGEDKKPHPAVSLGEYTVLDYDEAKAFDWAKETGLALELDVKGFEKIAKVSPPEFVEVKTEVRARIATDLSEWA